MPSNSPRLALVRDKRTGELLEIPEDDFRRDRHESVVAEPAPQTPAKKAAPARTPETDNSKKEQ
jgi:hypothetical protein